MKYTVVIKLFAIGLVTVLLMVPLVRIHGLVRERQAARDAAVQEIARGSGLAQRVTGPVLIVPVVRTVRSRVTDPASGRPQEVAQEEPAELVLLPERLEADVQLATEQRRRGIYEARLFRATQHLTGHFLLPAELGRGEGLRRAGRPWVALGVTDIRGIGSGLQLRLNGAPAVLDSGARAGFLEGGVHALLPEGLADGPEAARLDFDLQLPLQGTGQYALTPMGRETVVRMSSDWPHPGFTGAFLPVTREVDAQGFRAEWQTSFFATNLQEKTLACAATKDCRLDAGTALGVNLLDPVDQYVKTDRAIKYALLFILLTFAGFVLMEVLGRAQVHPVQYGLVGLALSLFFLLLLSLAEHIGFGPAYLLSSLACVALIGVYLASVLHSPARGHGFAGALGLVYGLLYAILSAEDYALLTGALLLFAVLAAFMVLTRRVDWSLGRARPAV